MKKFKTKGSETSSTEPIERCIHELRTKLPIDVVLNVRIDSSVKFKVDSVTLCRIATNLLTNAAEAESLTEVTCETIKENNYSVLMVSNDGKIPTEKMIAYMNVGERFTSKETGTGLGITYCRGQTLSHDGKFQVQILGRFLQITVAFPNDV